MDLQTPNRKENNSRSERSCRSSPSSRSRRIPEWDLPEEADAPAPPENHTNRTANGREHRAHGESFLHPASSWQSLYPGGGSDTFFRRRLSALPSLQALQSLPSSEECALCSFNTHTHTQRWLNRTQQMLQIIEDGKEKFTSRADEIRHRLQMPERKKKLIKDF